MPLVVKQDEAPNPIHVGLLGANAVILDPDALADAVEQQGRGRA
jgi:hypothetical protein